MHGRRDVGKRLVITGTTGSGKTFLAQRLSGLLKVQHTNLDRIVLDNRGQRKPSGESSPVLETAALSEGWVLEGLPWDVPDHAWSRASAVVLIEMPRVIRAWWLFRRNYPRRLSRTRKLAVIRHALTAPRRERDRRRRYVRDKTPANVPFIEISSVKDIRELIRDVGAA